MSTRRRSDYKGFTIVATCCATNPRAGIRFTWHSANLTVLPDNAGVVPWQMFPEAIFASCDNAIDYALTIAARSIDRVEASVPPADHMPVKA